AGKGDAPRIAGEYRARRGVDLRRDERRGGAARGPEHPFGVSGDGEGTRTPRTVPQRQARNLDRIGQRHELQQLERDAVRLVLEAAVAEAVPGDVGPAVADGLRRRAPEIAAVFVADIDRFAGGV